MRAKLNDFSTEFLKIIVDVTDLLLLPQVRGLEISQRTVYLYFEVRLQLLHVLDYRLLFTI